MLTWGGEGRWEGERSFVGLRSLRLVREEREKSSRSFPLPPELLGLRYGSFKGSSVMQLSIRQSPLKRLSIVLRFAFCQNDSSLDEGSIIEQIVHFPGQLHP